MALPEVGSIETDAGVININATSVGITIVETPVSSISVITDGINGQIVTELVTGIQGPPGPQGDPGTGGGTTYDDTALQAAVASKAPIDSPTFTGVVGGITKSMVGLSNVDNTSDANKPLSTATTTALAGKAPTSHVHTISDVTNLQTTLDGKAASSHTHTSSAITDFTTAVQSVVNTQLDIAGAPGVLDTINELAAAINDDANFATTMANSLALKAPLASPTFTGTVSGISKSMVGLGNVDNTSDVNKPVSTATTTALGLKVNKAGDTMTGTLTAPMVDKAGQVYNVKGYGAVGDGTTDDTAAFQAAINAAATATGVGGGVVYVPAGTYITSPLVMKSRVSIRGAGPNSVLRLKNGSNAHMFTLFDGNTEQCGWVDLLLDGNKANQTSGNVVHLDNSTYTNDRGYPSPGDPSHYMQRVEILNGKGHGVYTSGSWSASQFISVWVWGCDVNSFYVASPDNTLSHCISANTGFEGFFIAGNSERIFDSKAFTAGRLDATKGSGFRIAYVSRTDMIGCEAQDNRQHGFSISGAQQLHLVGRADHNGLGASGTGGVGDGLYMDTTTKSRIDIVSGDRNAGETQRWAYNCGTGNDGNIVTIAAGDNKSVGTIGNGSFGANSIVNITYNGAATVLGLTKSMVGLSNVDNTADTAKPISTATQTALNAKEASITAGTTAQFWRGDKSWQTLNADVVPDGTTNKAFLATERTKLSGVATGATANSTDAVLLARANHTGTQSADTLTDGSTNKAFLATERTKLSGVATGATANSTDATLLNRANHTGTQLAATISDSTPFGRSLLNAADAAAARALTGAGTSNLTIGTTGATAKAGNYTPPVADLPGAIVMYSSSATARPTSRTDVMVIFTSTADPAAVTLDGDVWIRG